ncbi:MULTISPECIES: phosphohistidine phosphatase SixA [Rahnella]|uniref:Phosphohistidine phosphatase SixA n=1 Tax=Rahnella laticis TaxID=2787622 RepID=A0ABS0ECB1_9GAMM|nr:MULTISPECIES: phosphohistidine phosphatase SixA [Rahnella]MBF7982717.1 phosphohistidine phosphatase SixA [Rahnella laticis]MBF7995724.1 phosphohistidine phosphatase SixA [Rahnella laticis]MBF8002782.1 phosphohistidine phosphatase SixA [Rahnella sp. LAC-M12]
MQVVIMRHGDAVLEAASDSVRPLSECGCDESVHMAAWLNGRGITIDRVLVSPYLRAQQTLEKVRQCLSLPENVEIDILKELTPGGDPALVASELQHLAQTGVNAVLVVSHLPLVGYLVAELCPGVCPPMFATSAMASVELNAQTGQGSFDWQFSPCQVMAKV